jgi:hypothetical protein
MDDVEPSAAREAEGNPPRAPERRPVLAGVASRPGAGSRQGIAVDLDPFAALEGLRVALLPLRTDHRHVPARLGQRSALLPDPPIERNRQVLDEDQRVTTVTHHATPR